MNGTPGPEELARLRQEMASNLLLMSEQMAPMFDAADGIRADMLKRGWSPASAERVSLAWLMNALDSAMRGAS